MRLIIVLAILSVAVPGWATAILRTNVDADLDGSGTATCIVDSDAGIAAVRARVTSPDGTVVANVQNKAEFTVNWAAPETRKVELEFKVSQPLLWTEETPGRYGIQVELLDSQGLVLAQDAGTFAFCRLEVRSDDGFYLNGQKLRLRGVNSPRDTWPENADARMAACRAVVRDVRWLNANAIWCTNAVPVELLELCDATGVFVVGEVPPAEDGRHPCVIKWRKTDGIKIVASPTYGTLRWAMARESQMTLAVPLLPQEGAGGLGAGLEDCWAAICRIPRCVGGILQARAGWTAAELGANGRAIREVWAPVSCSMVERTVAFINRSRVVGLDVYRYAWQALVFGEQGERVLAEGGGACPATSAGGNAQIQLPPMPPDTQAVRLTVFGRDGEAVCAWCSRVTRERTVGWPTKGCAPPPGLKDVYFLAGARTNRVRNAKNRVMLGPRFDFFSPPDSKLDVTWGRMADGAYRLDYKLACRANVELLGFAFPPLRDVIAERWVGSGPDGVWANRLQGAAYGLWECGSEGVGFVSDVDWFEIATKAGI